MNVSRLLRLTVAGLMIAGLSLATADAESPARRQTKPKEKPQTVEFFDGIKTGALKVRVVPKDEFLSKVRITNTLDKPVSIKLPDGVAAVHVLKQVNPGAPFDPNGFNNNNNNSNNSQFGNGQSIGGQFGGYGNNNFGNQPGNGIGFNQGFFSIPAKRTRELKLNTVCLQYGKPSPRLKMRYELRPLKEVVSDSRLQQLLKTYDPRQTDRMVMQAAAWNLTGLSWRTLQAKKRRRIGLRATPLFNRRQLETAYKLVEAAGKKSDATPKSRVTASRLR